MPAHLSAEQLARDLSIRDLTDPAAGPHAVQLVLDRAVGRLADRWGCEVRWWRGERIVTVEDNYDNLGYRSDDITRDSRYTRYVDDQRMLRSHSSALIPAALRALAAEPADDVLLVCPGLVYRRDSIDRLHTGTPHQLDLWRITPPPGPHDHRRPGRNGRGPHRRAPPRGEAPSRGSRPPLHPLRPPGGRRTRRPVD
ncbi:hypothetical protein [Streptomyces sp. NEAU-S7GS2]|uniref:tRNA ligase subunit PheS family protein n=1 Tax=Streptomyces sp. NEAU-S7GS2 TaxID=2202000 RepID=UPI0013A575A4|nr:hypothetical protein [Streptomyces sp. NEAU-S7GS2]